MASWPPIDDEPARLLRNFWERVDRRREDECWIWRGAVGVGGYGVTRLNKNYTPRTFLAHRLALWFSGVEFSREAKVLHSCDTPLCCNPRHLRIGTQSENVRDMHERNRRASFKGERNGRAKLSREDVVEIRRLLAAGLSQEKVAKRFGVWQTNIGRIARRETWPDVLVQ